MKFLGLMSGTSLDGIDVALLEVGDPDSRGARESSGSPVSPGWELLAFRTWQYTDEQREAIRAVLASGDVRETALLHMSLGEWFATSAMETLHESGIGPESVSAVGSHGQTVWHEPPRGSSRGASLQLGCPATLAERTGIGVVSDFRARDLAAGGHGAPLVPWADRVFFSSPDDHRAIQNLGGMANVTWLPRTGDPAPLVAFDTGPGVALIDEGAAMATGGRARFDAGGEMARRGKVSAMVLARLMELPFFQETPPRSTGRELFGPELVREAVKLVESETGVELLPGQESQGWLDLVATLTAFTAGSIGDAYRRFIIPRGVGEVFLAGGGSRNPALFEAIVEELSPLPVLPGESLGMDPDAREAAAFALLAWAHLEGIPANVPEATGSRGLRVLGSWTPGRKGEGE